MSTMITVSLLMPFSLCGQGGRTDGFFSNDGDYNNRDGEVSMSGGLTNESFNTPLGSGLLVMTIGGVGYLLMKKKRRTMNVVVVVSLLLCMTQCKKQKEMFLCDQKCVNITLDVSEDVKADVNLESGAVTFVDGDEIIVANNGIYIGRLTREDGIFSGTVLNPSSDDYLHFYHLGNAELPDLVAGSTTSCSFSIADQINGLPVISYGHSIDKYSSDKNNYEAKLQNKCALVKFNVTTSSTFAATCITGMKNRVSVDFGSAAFDYDMVNDGKITLPSGSGERWAILLPQDEVEAGEEGSAFSGRYIGTRGMLPAISINDYIDDGTAVVINTLTQPEGALNGLFTINSDGKQVVFAKSNLSYVIADKEWRFMDAQYSQIEVNKQNIGSWCCNMTTITFFLWGQTGYKHGSISYIPNDTDTGLYSFWAYGDSHYNLNDCNGQADWGYVVITNGGNANKQWRTLTGDEWVYIMTQRPDAAQKYGRAIIGGKHKGVVILPDNWEAPYDGCFTGGSDVACADNKYTISQWNEMEEAGALFIPYAGYRFTETARFVNQVGRIWTSSACNNEKQAYMVSLTESEYKSKCASGRNNGHSVRLVCE